MITRFNTPSTKLKPFNSIPGPKQLPFFGFLFSLKQFGKLKRFTYH